MTRGSLAAAVGIGVLVTMSLAGCGDDDARPPEVDAGGSDAAVDTCATAAPLCAPTAMAECEGPRTTGELPGATVRAGCPMRPITNDAPASGFAPGETTVTWSIDGVTATCLTRVSVVDTIVPDVTCPPDVTLVRATPTELVPAPAAIATDGCDGTVVATPEPAALGHGTTSVRYQATDAAGNSAECTTTVTVRDALPPRELRLASARLDDRGVTSITLAWDPPDGGDATGYRVERATAAAGPWEALATVASTRLLYSDVAMPGLRAYYRVVALVDTLEGGATPPVRALAVGATGYDLRGQAVPTVPFATTLYGVVRYPVDLAAGPYPLVVEIHGNHGNCRPVPFDSDDVCSTNSDHECPFDGFTTTPNAEGMLFQAETLAARGYVAVTVSANALNCRADYILERGRLVIEHIRRWHEWTTTGAPPFGTDFVGAVDTTRVGLVGHSRGGEAVAHVPAQLASAPIGGVAIGSVFSIAPTDYHRPNPRGVPYAVLAPACDGDVITLDGINIYDRALDAADPSPRSQVFVVGANHNFFSTEWRYDDNGDTRACALSDEIGVAAQQAIVETTLGSWFDGTLGDAFAIEPWQRAEELTPAGIVAYAGRDIDLRWSYSAPARRQIDDFTGSSAPTRNLLGLANSFAGYTSPRACFQNACDTAFDHAQSAVLLSWSGGTPIASFELGSIDATSYAALSFRITSRQSTLNTGRTFQDLVVRVLDASGVTAELRLSDVQRVPHLYPTRMLREILQTVRVPLAQLVEAAPALDVAHLARFELEATVPGFTMGSLLVTDVELAE